jgi:hypothetical protein
MSQGALSDEELGQIEAELKSPAGETRLIGPDEAD